MNLILLSLGIALFSAVLILLNNDSPQRCSSLATSLSLVAAGAGLIPCVATLASGTCQTLVLPWEVPFGAFALRLDALSAFFLVPIFGLGALAAVYGGGYLLHDHEQKNHGFSWFCFFLLWASMGIVVLADHALLFLVAWELTVLSSFFLVVQNGQADANREAGRIYMIASHLGVGFLIVLFLILARETGSLDFQAFFNAAHLSPSLKGLLFLLAVVGFGSKAGFVPLHVWLPEAHPAAPSHVSALMSGVMIKTGVYGLVRVLFFLGHPAPWWGWTLLLIGLASGILGVLFALAQHDLKRLLAYHSVENIGIITLGLGLGVLGLSYDNTPVAVLGFAGGLLHVVNHAVFKGLLFLGAGAVREATGTLDIDRLGGLLKTMPWTGSTFLTGCLSISGLPPFNGFISEFLIYYGAFLAVLTGPMPLAAAGLALILGLSLIGGLACACFSKAFSVVFLGSPRHPLARTVHEVGPAMRLPMVALSALCLLIALASPFLLEGLGTVIIQHPDFTPLGTAATLARALHPLLFIGGGAMALGALLALLFTIRRHLLQGREVRQSVTWDCGFAKPATSMQYTGSSFAQPLTELFEPVLKTETHLEGVDTYFPRQARFHSHTPDLFQNHLFEPLFRAIGGLLFRFNWIQNGVVQVYVLYITVTLVVLLIGGLM